MPCKPYFHYIEVGFKGVFIARTCCHDDATGIDISSDLDIDVDTTEKSLQNVTHAQLQVRIRMF